MRGIFGTGKNRKVLFNKNHILLEVSLASSICDPNFVKRSSSGFSFVRRPNNEKPVRVKKESPLGFYYYSTTNPPKEIVQESFCFTHISFGIGKLFYTLTYPTSFGNNSIGSELRPWSIGDTGMEEHFITDLLKEVTELFDLAKDIKAEFDDSQTRWQLKTARHEFTGLPVYYYPIRIKEVRDNVFRSLFGDEKGPRFQTNEEKILSHGFDLKTSFRK